MKDVPKRPDPYWRPGPTRPVLPSDEVHVWLASLDLGRSRARKLEKALTADERKTAAGYRFQKDRDRFVIRRGLLRMILGRYLDLPPGQLQFCYSPYGKPALTPGLGTDWLHFNLSHSYGLALYAVTGSRRLGIDLERINAEIAKEKIAERFFSHADVETLRALPKTLQAEGFFCRWTHYEAFVKAKGEGLSAPLHQFEAPLASSNEDILLHVEPHDAVVWSLTALAPWPGYAAALCVEGEGWRLRRWSWQDEERIKSSPS